MCAESAQKSVYSITLKQYYRQKYLPRISSKILYKPGTKVTSLQFIPTSSSYTHISYM